MTRRPGLSAMLRVRNEAEWLAPSLESVLPWCDEVVICVQPSQDETLQIAQAYAERHPHVVVHFYPFHSWPNGPGYRAQNPNHPQSRTYFYNWALERTTCDHVIKWDGDMVAQDWLGDRVWTQLRAGQHYIRMVGINLTQVRPHIRLSEQRNCPTDGVFLVTDATRYVNGHYSERLCGLGAGPTINEAFLHFKWCKASARQAWPENWAAIEHFQRIEQRARPGPRYDGTLPSVLAEAL